MIAAALLIIQTALAGPPVNLNPMEGPPHRSLIYSVRSANGTRLCDRTIGRRWAVSFERRFGVRLRALMIALETRYGADEMNRSLIFTSDCTRRPGTYTASAQRFEMELREWERFVAAPAVR